ncbi:MULTISPECIES: LysR family transcriptional regulator [unclassified Caballeronia]|uniref:LysR family transcriptional regulator n=1 Tax=unclassified Caballeronia TaxID=2646786 RepID=UPI002856A89D|nr:MULTISPECIES: LysR family transcriptional regulator [unclassified Caballeronia]MDR5822307.1 LysR family transcriptional regulator [Caballeronia sp. LZ043]MDR5883478.1 LysR family transcriptional regulator [Caballeronia sp. LZ032]
MFLPDIRTFLAVVSAGSLSAAARQLNVAPMQVSRRIAVLEDDLGVRLFHRTTRSLTLTAEGEAFAPYAQAMVDAEAGARADLSPLPGKASGVLRITAPSGFGQSVVLPMLPGLLEANPELRVDLDLSDRQLDIVGQGLDLALRIAPLEDSELVARLVVPNPRMICASPGYIRRHGQPANSAELEQHRCIRLDSVGMWPLIVDGVRIRKRIDGPVATTSVEAARTAAVQGLGLVMLSYWDVFRQLNDHSLVEVRLKDAAMEELSVWAVIPSRRYVPNRVNVFLAALQGEVSKLAAQGG